MVAAVRQLGGNNNEVNPRNRRRDYGRQQYNLNDARDVTSKVKGVVRDDAIFRFAFCCGQG
jgi:hypothetical protein